MYLKKTSHLKRRLTFIFLFLMTSTCWSQVMVSGVVFFKDDNSTAPGVHIIEKGTENGSTSQLDGTFSILVSDLNATLVFSYVGSQKKEVQLKGKNEIVVKLKLDCNKDFFDAYQITLIASSGLIHTPIGGYVEITSPYTSIGVLKSSYSFQTNLVDNVFQTGKVEISHPISTCEFDMDFRWSFRKISFNQNLESFANSGEAQLNLRNIQLIAGYSHLYLTKKAENLTNSSSGILLGLGKDIFLRPFHGTFSAKVAIYDRNFEYQVELKSGYRWFQYFVRYYKLDTFDELSLGVGVQLSYYKRKMKG